MNLLKRKIDKFLIEWKQSSNKKPLIVKGARQIVKTESIRNFAKNNYANVIEINFALQKQYKDIKYGIKLSFQNIGFNGSFYTFPYFLIFLLKRYLR